MNVRCRLSSVELSFQLCFFVTMVLKVFPFVSHLMLLLISQQEFLIDSFNLLSQNTSTQEYTTHKYTTQSTLVPSTCDTCVFATFWSFETGIFNLVCLSMESSWWWCHMICLTNSIFCNHCNVAFVVIKFADNKKIAVEWPLTIHLTRQWFLDCNWQTVNTGDLSAWTCAKIWHQIKYVYIKHVSAIIDRQYQSWLAKQTESQIQECSPKKLQWLAWHGSQVTIN